MDAKSIRERCLSYIDEWDSNPEYAILLTGAWGCGKTYFVQNLLKERNKKTPKLAWYISLFGVQSSVDIDARLFEAAHPIIGDVEKQEYFAVVFNVLRSAGKYTCGIDVKNIAHAVLRTIKLKKYKQLSCQVLFVDDVERADMQISDIFGYFDHIVRGNTRVIFISNEDELRSYDAAYDIVKEKIIGETYQLSPDYDSALDEFCVMEEGKKWNAIECKGELQNIIDCLGIKNLRILRQTMHQWGQLFERLPKEYQEDDEYVCILFEEFVVLMIGYKLGLLTQNTVDNKVGENGREKINGNLLCYDTIVNNMQSFWSSYKGGKRLENDDFMKKVDEKKTHIGKIMYPLQCEEVWPYILMQGWYAESTWLEERLRHGYEEYRKVVQNRERSNMALQRLGTALYFPKKDSVNDISVLFQRLEYEFYCGVYIRFDDIISYVKLWLELLSKEILPEKYQYITLERRLRRFIECHRTKIYALPALEPVSKEEIQLVSDKGVQNCINEIFDEAKKNIGCVEDKIFKDPEAFCVYISDPDHAVTYAPSIPFLTGKNPLYIVKLLGDNLDNHRNLLKFLEYRYRKNFGNDRLHCSDYGEVQSVREIATIYEEKYQELKNSFRLDILEYYGIYKKYNELIAYMEEEIKKAKGGLT